MSKTMLSQSDFQAIRRWMYRCARPVELALWQFHFEGGPREAVLAALSAFQNPDGGIGHALEADCWNTASAPIQTGDAILLLDSIGFGDPRHPLAQGICRWIAGGSCREGGYWQNTIPSNDQFPRAPWWSYAPGENPYNPTALMLGFLLQYGGAEERASAKPLAAKLLRRMTETPVDEPHSAACCFYLLKSVERAGLMAELSGKAALAALCKAANALLERDTAKWSGYSCKPSQFISSPAHPLYAGNETLVEAELDWAIDGRSADGVWDIPWGWGAFPEEFAVSRIWWQGRMAVERACLLKNFGRIAQ